MGLTCIDLFMYIFFITDPEKEFIRYRDKEEGKDGSEQQSEYDGDGHGTP